MALVIPYRKRGLRRSMSPSETAKLMQMKVQLEQQIKALEEQINLEKIALTVGNWSQQRFNTLKYKDHPAFASIFSFTYDQTMGVNSKGFFILTCVRRFCFGERYKGNVRAKKKA